MVTKELIHSAIDRIGDEHLEELYRVIQDLVESKKDRKKNSFMSRLKKIKIDAPEDFAANLDLYMSGEKSVKQDIR